MTTTISGLYYYPLKSAGGHSVERLRWDVYGPEHDRRWLVVDADGQFMTQRQLPQMARIEAQVLAGGGLRLSMRDSDLEPLVVGPASTAAATSEVQVWRDVLLAADCGNPAADWLSVALEKPVRLVTQHADSRRAVDPAYAKNGEQTVFSDGFPFLLISEASLEDLNDRLAEKGRAPLPMDRFRPNIVVSGCEPYAEDSWTHIRIAGQSLQVVKPCARCAITTTDQSSGERPDSEPLRTLVQYRRQGKEVFFGQNVLALESEGCLEIGMPIELKNESHGAGSA